MSRIHTPERIENAPAASQDLLKAVQAQLGSVPNMFRIISNSPAALEGYLGLNTALSKGELSVATRERISLAVAEYNQCNYCLAAHTYLGLNVAKLTEAEIQSNRHGHSTDAKADVAVRFSLQVLKARGHVRAEDVEAVRAAGFSDASIIEIVELVALNVLTNYTNSVLATEIDFPVADELVA